MKPLSKLPLGHGSTVHEHDNGSPLFGGHFDARRVESHGEQVAQKSARYGGQVSQRLIVVKRKSHIQLYMQPCLPCQEFYLAARKPFLSNFFP